MKQICSCFAGIRAEVNCPLPDDVIEAVRAILEHGNTAEIKRRKNGEIIVLEVRRKVKKSAVQ